MNPIVDQFLVALLILSALGFLARGVFTRKSKSCASGCGCQVSKKPALLPPPKSSH